MSSAARAVAGRRRRPVAEKRSSAKASNGSGGIGPSSICLALRQNGSLASLKMRSIMWRLEPR